MLACDVLVVWGTDKFDRDDLVADSSFNRDDKDKVNTLITIRDGIHVCDTQKEERNRCFNGRVGSRGEIQARLYITVT